jgi:hypothetical protein
MLRHGHMRTSAAGFCAQKTRKDGGQWNERPISGRNTSPRWSRQAFRPSSTDCAAGGGVWGEGGNAGGEMG